MWRIRTSMTNLAQILLLFVLFPLFALICETIMPTSSITNLISFLGQVPMCDVLADLLSQVSSSFNSGDVAEITLWVFFKEFPTAMIAGLSVHLCTGIFDFIWSPLTSRSRSFRPLPILPGFLGIFLAAIVTGLIELNGSDMITFISEIGVIIVMLIGIKLLFSSLKVTRVISVTKALGWIIDGLYAVILAAYVATMMLIIKGILVDTVKAITMCVIMAVITIVASAIVYFVKAAID